MKKKVLVSILLFVVFIIVIAPAKLVKNMLPKNSPAVLGTMSGTVWSGYVSSASLHGWNVQDINYQLDFLPLITGSLSGEVEISKGDLEGTFEFVTTGTEDVELSQANLEMAAQRLENFMPFPGIKINGVLSTTDFSASIESQKILSMAGATAWKDAVVTVRNKDWSLGLLVIDWTFNEESQLIKGKFRKTQNLLDIAGTIELQPSGQLEFKGSVSERIDKSIYSALMLFADGKSANGRLPIKFRKKIQ